LAIAPLALRARRKQIGIWLIAVKAPVAWKATEGPNRRKPAATRAASRRLND
jgi:hypothetical protein